MPSATSPARRALTVCLAAALLTSGCSGFIQRTTGDTMVGYSTEHMIPYLLATGDVDVACRVGAGLGQFLSSFERVDVDPNVPGILSDLSAAMCAEDVARAEELRAMRAVFAGNATEANDARRAQTRAHGLAALRYKSAYDRWLAAFGYQDGKGCPEIDPALEHFYLLGTTAGLLSVIHDRAGKEAAGVPLDVPRVAARAVACLESGKWWGMPSALQAAVWQTVPGSAPEGKDPEKIMAAAVQAGDAAQIRLARALHVNLLASQGKEAALREGIKAHYKVTQKTPPDTRWQLLDHYGAILSRHESDKIWTREKGYRASVVWGDLPEKPGEKKEDPAVDGLLDDLDDLGDGDGDAAGDGDGDGDG